MMNVGYVDPVPSQLLRKSFVNILTDFACAIYNWMATFHETYNVRELEDIEDIALRIRQHLDRVRDEINSSTCYIYDYRLGTIGFPLNNNEPIVSYSQVSLPYTQTRKIVINYNSLDFLVEKEMIIMEKITVMNEALSVMESNLDSCQGDYLVSLLEQKDTMRSILDFYHQRHYEPTSKIQWFIENTQTFLHPRNSEANMIVDNPGLFKVLSSIADGINSLQKQLTKFPRMTLTEDQVTKNQDNIYANDRAVKRIEEECSNLIYYLKRDFEEMWEIFNRKFLGFQQADDDHAGSFLECCDRIGIGLNQASLRPTPYDGLAAVNTSKSYWDRSLDQAINGSASGESTLLGTLMEIGVGFIPGVGQAADVRDINNAVEQGDVGLTILAGIGFAPGGDLIKGLGKGVLKVVKKITKNGDEIVNGARYGGRRISDLEYKQLRDQTPSKTIQDAMKDQTIIGAPDPALPGKTITKTLHADHIVSMDKITKMEGFDLLTKENKLKVLNYEKNFIGLSESANTSKGAKSFVDWVRYKPRTENLEVNPAFRNTMIAKEKALERELQSLIDGLLKTQ